MKTATVLSALFAVALGTPSLHEGLYRRQGQNFQTFTGALGGVAATPVTDSGDAKRKFQVKGDTFVNLGGALQRSCDQQFNGCADKANGGDKTLSVSACSDQKTQCNAASKSAAAGNQGAANGTAPATGASGNSTAAATGASTNGSASKNPCDTAGGNGKGNAGEANGSAGKDNGGAGNANQNAGQASSNAGKADQNQGAAGKNNGTSNNQGNKGAAAKADPCNQKAGAANRRSIAERRITRRYKVNEITRRYKVA